MTEVTAKNPEGPLEALITVQDYDVFLSQLEHRIRNLDERNDLERVVSALEELAGREKEIDTERQGLVDQIADCETQVSSLSRRSRSLQDRLQNDRGLATRDLQAIDEEIRQLSRRRSAIEEVELGLMEEQEPVDAARDQMAEERAQLETAAGSLRMAITAAETVVLAEIGATQQLRAAAAERIPAPLRERYDTLCARLGGIGAARLIGNHCEGCHLELSSVEVEKIRALPPQTAATCDQCGRILVRTSRSSS